MEMFMDVCGDLIFGMFTVLIVACGICLLVCVLKTAYEHLKGEAD